MQSSWTKLEDQKGNRRREKDGRRLGSEPGRMEGRSGLFHNYYTDHCRRSIDSEVTWLPSHLSASLGWHPLLLSKRWRELSLFSIPSIFTFVKLKIILFLMIRKSQSNRKDENHFESQCNSSSEKFLSSIRRMWMSTSHDMDLLYTLTRVPRSI